MKSRAEGLARVEHKLATDTLVAVETLRAEVDEQRAEAAAQRALLELKADRSELQVLREVAATQRVEQELVDRAGLQAAIDAQLIEVVKLTKHTTARVEALEVAKGRPTADIEAQLLELAKGTRETAARVEALNVELRSEVAARVDAVQRELLHVVGATSPLTSRMESVEAGLQHMETEVSALHSLGKRLEGIDLAANMRNVEKETTERLEAARLSIESDLRQVLSEVERISRSRAEEVGTDSEAVKQLRTEMRQHTQSVGTAMQDFAKHVSQALEDQQRADTALSRRLSMVEEVCRIPRGASAGETGVSPSAAAPPKTSLTSPQHAVSPTSAARSSAQSSPASQQVLKPAGRSFASNGAAVVDEGPKTLLFSGVLQDALDNLSQKVHHTLWKNDQASPVLSRGTGANDTDLDALAMQSRLGPTTSGSLAAKRIATMAGPGGTPDSALPLLGMNSISRVADRGLTSGADDLPTAETFVTRYPALDPDSLRSSDARRWGGGS